MGSAYPGSKRRAGGMGLTVRIGKHYLHTKARKHEVNLNYKLRRLCFGVENQPIMPSGTIRYGERIVQSRDITFPHLDFAVYIKGRFDIVVELDDGSYGVIDFKTGKANEEKIALYANQLHAYAYALEHPATEALELRPVTLLGLLYFTPDDCHPVHDESPRQSLIGPLEWYPIEKDETSFLSFMETVVEILAGPVPDPDPSCDWCRYAANRYRIDHEFEGNI